MLKQRRINGIALHRFGYDIDNVDTTFYFIPSSEFNAYLKQIKVVLSAVKKYRIFSLVTNTIYISYGTMFMAYRVYLSDYLPLDISTTAAYLSIGANQFALKILKLFN